MPLTVNLDEAADRPIRRDLEVGLTEILVGLITLVCGSMILLWKSHFSALAPWAGAAVLFLAGFFIKKAIAKLRSSEEFPRIGYTKLEPSRERKISRHIAGVIFVVLVPLLLNASGFHITRHDTVTAFAYALLVSVCFFYIAVKYRMPSGIWFGLFCIAWALLAYFWAGSTALPSTMLGIGSGMILDGVWHFVRFRRTHPMLETPES